MYRLSADTWKAKRLPSLPLSRPFPSRRPAHRLSSLVETIILSHREAQGPSDSARGGHRSPQVSSGPSIGLHRPPLPVLPAPDSSSFFLLFFWLALIVKAFLYQPVGMAGMMGEMMRKK